MDRVRCLEATRRIGATGTDLRADWSVLAVSPGRPCLTGAGRREGHPLRPSRSPSASVLFAIPAPRMPAFECSSLGQLGLGQLPRQPLRAG